VHSARNKGSFLLSLALEVSYRQELDIVSSRGFSKGFALENRRIAGVVSDVKQVAVEHAVSVGWTVSKVDDIVFLSEIVGKGKSIVRLIVLGLYVILDIPNVLTSPRPRVTTLFASHCYLHSIFEGRVLLEEIENMESRLPPNTAIANSEEKPLGAACCIHILLEKEVIFVLEGSLNSKSQISAFKSALEIEEFLRLGPFLSWCMQF
jgi:hypothetical protein